MYTARVQIFKTKYIDTRATQKWQIYIDTGACACTFRYIKPKIFPFLARKSMYLLIKIYTHVVYIHVLMWKKN